MPAPGPKVGLGKYVYRLYAAGYIAVLGFGLLGDLAGEHAVVSSITPRTSAAAGLVVVLIVVVLGLGGRRAVALRPTPAEIQLSVMSPLPRRVSLSRTVGVGATSGAIAAAMAALALMLTSSKQFAGLTVAIQLGYVAFAAGIGVVLFGAHLLVAERRSRVVLAAVALVLVAGSVADVVGNTTHFPTTVMIESLRQGGPALTVLITWVIGIALTVIATRDAEDIPMEMVNRGSDLADRATFALVGNDLRALLLLQRSIGAHAWRRRPRIRIPSRLARRFPVTVRAARSMLRWRLPRITFVLAAIVTVSGLLRVHPATTRTVGLSTIALWALGLAIGEPLAQEQDRVDRLELLPRPRWIEYRHVLVSWGAAFGLLLVGLLIALDGRVSVASTIAVAVAAASAATVGATKSVRKGWKLVFGESAGVAFLPEVAGPRILFSVLSPAIMAAACLVGWVVKGATPAGIALPGLAVLALQMAWIGNGPAITKFFQEATGGVPQ